MKRLTILLFIIYLIGRQNASAIVIPIDTPQAIFQTEPLVDFINAERKLLGLRTLTENLVLDQTAAQKCRNIANRNYWSHTDAGGALPWTSFTKLGYFYKFAGENLARGYTDDKSAMLVLMQSKSHRKNILSPNYREIGIGRCEDFIEGKYRKIIVQHFGSI